MTREFQIYQGAEPQAPQVGGVQVPHFANIPQNGAAVDAAIGDARDLTVSLRRLHDLGLQQRVAQERERIRTEMDVEMQQAAALPLGSAESLFRADGSVNQDRYDAIVAKYWGECDKIEPGEFALGENAARYAGEQEEERNGLALRMMKFAALKTIDNTRKAFADNLRLAEGKGDWGAARKLVEDARGCLLNDAEADAELLRLGRGRLRKVSGHAGDGGTARVNIGGTGYRGLSAALRAQQVRDGYRDEPGGQEPETEAMGQAEQEEPLGQAAGDGGLKPPASNIGEASPVAEVAAADEGEDDFEGVLRSMGQGELDGLTGLWVNDGAIARAEREDGTVAFAAASPAAPAAVERVAAVADAQGGINPEAARAMVARIAMDAVAQDDTATAEQVCRLFDGSGVYEAMGDGDEDVGKLRVTAVAEEMVKRGRQGSLVLNQQEVKRVVDAAVAEDSFGEGSEWKVMERLQPPVAPDKKWDKPDDEAERKRWFALFGVYKKYRDRFNPQHGEGDADKDEFAEKAANFWRWYMGGSHVYKDLKEAETDAARDWYCAKAFEALLGHASVGKDGKAGYGSYAGDVAVLRDVLQQRPPRNLGAEERLRMLESRERDDEARSAKFRQRAKDDYARLQEMKRATAENSEKSKKDKDREAAREQKAFEAEEKRAAAVAQRKMAVARSVPRLAEWVWNGSDGADGEMPACSVPEDEYKRLVEELGYDGSQVVYVQVDGAKIQVTGTNKRGRMELNTAAVAKVQKKPNVKKGETWKYRGNLGYSYYFKNVSANN